MSRVAVIIPTTGAPLVRQAIASVLAQTHPEVQLHVVVDGPEFIEPLRQSVAGMDLRGVQITVLPENVGRNGFYGHRVYAAFSHLVNTEYISFLDQDNWFEPEHLHTLVQSIERHGWQWAFALRRVVSEEGLPLIDDESQSLGPWSASQPYPLVDTSCYCLRVDAACRVASHWHGGWGQDRVFYANLAQSFPQLGCSGRYSVNYRTRPDLQQRVVELLQRDNAAMRVRYPQGFPWLQQQGPTVVAPSEPVQA